MRAIKDFTLKEKGKLYARFQSPAAEPPFAIGTSDETLIVDTDRGFVFDDLKPAKRPTVGSSRLTFCNRNRYRPRRGLCNFLA